MVNAELAACLREEVSAWSAKPYELLKSELANAVSYVTEKDDRKYTVEVQALELTHDYIHVGIDVEDGSLRRTFLPAATSFLVYRDGRVDV